MADEPALPVVGIGASAGGIEAFREFFEKMPAQSGLAFVVVLHLPANRKSLLPEILSRWTAMPVIEATDGCLVEANSIYVPVPGAIVTLRDRRLRLHMPGYSEAREPSPISIFFDSLALALGEDAIGIVLSGTGSDGALGLKAIRARGGLTLAQGVDGTAPQYPGMPASAIATGAVDIIAPVEDMPGRIIAVQEARRATGSVAGLSAEADEAGRLAICEALSQHRGHDFSGYKAKTFMRRVQRRMQVLNLRAYAEYVKRLEDDSVEAGKLFADLLIGVTSFFRDGETFETVARVICPRLFDGKGAQATIRVWVPGCATGEEAYSLAMLLRECADDLRGGKPRIQVFATDIDEPAVATARAGRYPSTLLEGVSRERLERFFIEGSDGSWMVAKEIRDLCTFSAHSLTRDPPFSRIDLVSCRNLLIYLDTDLQNTVIPCFHYALVPNGILLLGGSESVSRHEHLFSTLDRTHRIFERRNVPSPPFALSGSSTLRVPPPLSPTGTFPGGAPRGAQARLIGRATARVLERFGPAFVVVGAGGDIIQYSSRIGRFLEPAAGRPDQNILAMARRGLAASLRSALQQAAKTDRSVEITGVSAVVPGEGVRRLTLAIEPVQEHGIPTSYLVVFVETDQPRSGQQSEPQAATNLEGVSDRHFEADLRDLREQLQALSEDHETALEELRSANEELMSLNEELQSTNEEIETSKEESQSMNEELQTINSQLASKLDELDQKNADLRNLFESTQVATIFLDRYLVIRSFTPAVATIYNVIESDVGRPLLDLVSRLDYHRLREDIDHVITAMEPLERRVVRDDGKAHYLVRILPYRSPRGAVDGTLVTFLDVTSVVQAEHRQLLVDELNHRVKNMLTVVISMASQTMRRSSTLEQFSQIYLARVHALNVAYTLLSAEAWQTVSMRDLLVEGLRPFLTEDPANVVQGGPLILLKPQAALALSMAIHELTTNAVKYGALSLPDGNIRVMWRVERHEDGDQLVLNWIERKGPPVVPPSHRGFGMTLIERGLRQDLGAEVELSFGKKGLEVVIKAPLSGDGVQISRGPPER